MILLQNHQQQVAGIRPAAPQPPGQLHGVRQHLPCLTRKTFKTAEAETFQKRHSPAPFLRTQAAALFYWALGPGGLAADN